RLEEIGVFVIIAMVRLLPSVKELIRIMQVGLGYTPSLRNLQNRLKAMEDARESRGGTVKFTGLKRGIRFDDVCFTYAASNDVPALNGISFDTTAGDMVAIVGPSGAGKSTLIDLLPRLREPTTGMIYLDGTA